MTAPRLPAPSAKRPKFDKTTATTYLLAALVGLGAGASWRLADGARRSAPTETPARVATTERESTEAYAQVIVIDASGRLVAAYDGVRLASTAPNARPGVSIAQGRSQSAAAATRAS